MFGFLVPSYSPDTSIKLRGVASQLGKHVTAVRSSDLNHKQTLKPSDLFTDTLTIKLLTHTTIRYLNLQSHINQVLAEISRTCCLSPWFCRVHHPNDGGDRYSEMSLHICQTTWCHNWEYIWCQISLVCKKPTATTFTFIPSGNYASFEALR